MPHKNIVVTKQNKVSEETATVFKGNDVSFYPSDSDQAVTIAFQDGKNPFNWSSHSKTGDEGQPIRDTVVGNAGDYRYKASVRPGAAPGPEDAILGVPKLIVDPGPLVPPGADKKY